ncbi:MAG: hypothetical protein AB8B79_14990 [Granulosicoccus sp.]
MFEFLFNYPMSVWQNASLVFDSGWSLPVLLGCIGLALLLILISLWSRPLSLPRRTLVAMLQGLVAVIALTMVWRPALLVSVSERGENSVAWLLDASLSMDKQDGSVGAEGGATGSQTRFEAGMQAIEQFALDTDNEFSATLYTVGDELGSVGSLEDLQSTALSARTQLGSGLDNLLGTVNETALAAVVLLSDGADNSDHIDAQWWQQLAAAGVPVHTVGIGQAINPRDVELSSVYVPAVVHSGATVSARLTISHGDGGGLARVRITSSGDLIAADDIALPVGVEKSVHTVSFPGGESGVRQLEFFVEAPVNESDPTAVDPEPRNNRQPYIIQVVDKPKRILYVEGEPRWEYKFIRRALDKHPAVEIVSLLRTSPNKFYRQGVIDASELAQGFPVTREQLFSYDAIIIGSFEAAELNALQQTALRDFVSERGGSLLMLSGRQGLADGGWGRSVVSAALPVVLSNRLDAETYSRSRSQVMPTLAGLRTPWLQLDDDEADNLEAWRGLPAIADAQEIGSLKPGAVTLLQRSTEGVSSRGDEPLLVSQRYGRGRSTVLGTSGTWRWQMGLPSDDDRHERFWRQLLGNLVEDIVPRVAIEQTASVVRDVDTTALSVVAYNPDYTALQDSVLSVQLTQPDGSVRSVDLYPDNERPGRYSGELNTAVDGPYAVSVAAPLDGESPSIQPAGVEQWWVRESGNAEQFGANLQQGFLQRVADTTGGSYLPISRIAELDALLAQENAALKRENRLPLWNMPFFFLCLLFAKALEWACRLRWKRL